MAATQPIPPTHPIPLDLRKELFDTCPWRISDPLFGEMKTQRKVPYKKVQVLPTHADWRFVWRYFHHDKPHRYGIKRIFCIHEHHQVKAFELNLSSIDREAEKFKPTWDTEPRVEQRRVVAKRYQDTVAIFSPFQTLEEGGRKRTWTQIKVLPLWHGSKADLCHSICESGFVFFGKSALKPGEAGKGSTDEGYFGSGIYFTNSARYASDIYSQGHLLLAWVSMREPFPVVGDDQQLDMALLKGGGAYKHYNAHYVPVSPINSDPYCQIYHPAKPGQTPSCDEIVVFHKSQAIPRFWIELEIEVPYLMNPSDIPQFVQELIPHLFKILQKPEVDRDLKLRNVLNSELAFLLKLSADDDLEQKHTTLFEKLTQLIDSVGKIDKNVRQALVGNISAPQTAPPQLTTSISQAPVTNNPSFLQQPILPPSLTIVSPQALVGNAPTLQPPPQTTSSIAALSVTNTLSSLQQPAPSPPQPVINKPAYPLPAQEIKKLVGHSHYVYSLALLPDGTLASGSWDKTIKIWNPSTGDCLRTLAGHAYHVYSLAFLPNGTLASGSQDYTIKIWNPSTGDCLRTLSGHSYGVSSLAVLPDGTLASGSDDNTIKIWNPSTGDCLRTLFGHSDCVYSLAFLPDGTLASGSWDKTIKIWNPSTEACLRTLAGHSKGVRSLAVLPDGTLASGSWDKTIKIWNPSTGDCLRTLSGHSGYVFSLVLFPDGTLASGSYDNTIKIWNPSTGVCLRTLTGHSNGVISLAVLPDGTLASGSEDRTIKIWK
jgi:WD40 repeat protein